MIRTIVVDDSKSFRAAVAAILADAGDFEIIGTAGTGEEAVTLVSALKPDLVLMDVMMPGLDGLAATSQIMASAPCPVVVLSALMDTAAQRLAFDALTAGAVEVLPKPKDVRSPATRQRLVSTLRAMASVKVVRRRVARPSPKVSVVRLVVIGASTGGPPALRQVLSHLGPTFPAPVVIAQHLATGFVEGLSGWLRDALRMRVQVVNGAKVMEPGTIYLPTDEHHIVVEGSRVTTVRSEGDSVVPSVDRLIRSAQSFGPGVIGIILTGMGEDGANALVELRRSGHHTIVQDEESSVVYGMPRVARELGGATEELALSAIGPRLLALAGEA